jgi:hypothetical protein
VDRRIGPRLYVRVDGDLRPELAVEDIATDYRAAANPLAGSVNVTYRVVNRGNVRLAGSTAVSISGPLGVARQDIPPEEFAELLPGQALTITRQFSGVPALGYVVTNVNLEPDPTEDGALAGPSARSSRSTAFPVAVMLVALAAIFAVLARRAFRRHRSTDSQVLPSELVDDVSAVDEPQLA